jgi:vacuolar-type H+-ATPase catalytic subunit A/Vma1
VAIVIGKVTRVLGPVVHAIATAKVQMLEFVEVGTERLIGEVAASRQSNHHSSL